MVQTRQLARVKKKAKTQPSTSNLSSKQRKQIRRLASLHSVFKDDVIQISDLLNSLNTDDAISKFQRTMLQSLLDLIPVAEDRYRKEGTERSANAFNSMVSQSRELIADLQAERDTKQLALQLSREIIDPAFIGIAQIVIDNLHNLKRSMETYVPEKRHIQLNGIVRDTAKGIAQYIEDQRADIGERMVEVMN